MTNALKCAHVLPLRLLPLGSHGAREADPHPLSQHLEPNENKCCA
jgi:hypothetical protein